MDPSQDDDTLQDCTNEECEDKPENIATWEVLVVTSVLTICTAGWKALAMKKPKEGSSASEGEAEWKGTWAQRALLALCEFCVTHVPQALAFYPHTCLFSLTSTLTLAACTLARATQRAIHAASSATPALAPSSITTEEGGGELVAESPPVLAYQPQAPALAENPTLRKRRGVWGTVQFLRPGMRVGEVGKGREPPDGEEWRRLLCALTMLRSTLMCCTVVAILAVDFPPFPRRYRKSHTFGLGLMDLGPGGFAFVGPLTSALVKGRGASSGALKRNLAKVALTACLGLIRLAATSALDYDVDAEEYGLHWNFFFTLAVCQLASSLPLHPLLLALGGAATAGLYQALLLGTGLSAYVMQPERGPGWLSANKEGVASAVGYASLACLGMGAGYLLHHAAAPPHTTQAEGREPAKPARYVGGVCQTLCVTLAVFLALYIATSTLVEDVSRRSANLAYMFWVAFVCIYHTLLAWLLNFGQKD